MKIDTLQIARLDVKPGDTVVFKINQPLTVGNADHAREYVSRALPDGVKVLVLDRDAELSVIDASKRPAVKRRKEG